MDRRLAGRYFCFCGIEVLWYVLRHFWCGRRLSDNLLDSTQLVADSVHLGLPVIVVGVNYRLNIFAFGDGKGERNLALRDQELAIQWTQKHIGGFGGDKASTKHPMITILLLMTIIG